MRRVRGRVIRGGRRVTLCRRRLMGCRRLRDRSRSCHAGVKRLGKGILLLRKRGGALARHLGALNNSVSGSYSPVSTECVSAFHVLLSLGSNTIGKRLSHPS